MKEKTSFKKTIEGMDFEQAARRLQPVLRPTNLIESPVFGDESGNKVWLKPENLQETGAFKIRGAYNRISKLAGSESSKGLVASSAGNHAQGVAFAAKAQGVRATIVMPKTTPLIKVEATRSYGANVVLCGDCYDDAYEEALRIMKREGSVFVHPFNDPDVIEGQGTIGFEIMKELPETECILVPVGGGGLISGIALAAKRIKPSVKIIGVEPEGAQAMRLSIEKKELSCLERVDTIAEGVAVKKPGELAFEVVKNYVDQIITVTDYEIMEASLMLIEKHKLVAESAGALPLAALRKLKGRGLNTVCVISGGNIDVLTISSIISRGLVGRGRILQFTVDLPDKQGELLRVSELLAKMDANVIKLDHNQFTSLDRLMNVKLGITVETNGHSHRKEIIEKLEDEGFKIHVE